MKIAKLVIPALGNVETNLSFSALISFRVRPSTRARTGWTNIQKDGRIRSVMRPIRSGRSHKMLHVQSAQMFYLTCNPGLTQSFMDVYDTYVR